MKKGKVYIAGKIGNLPFDQVERKFQEAKLELIKMGYDARIPLEFEHNHGKSWAEYMLEDLSELNKCDCICMLPCWEDSPGAKIEHAFAVGAGKQVLIYEDTTELTAKQLAIISAYGDAWEKVKHKVDEDGWVIIPYSKDHVQDIMAAGFKMQEIRTKTIPGCVLWRPKSLDRPTGGLKLR